MNPNFARVFPQLADMPLGGRYSQTPFQVSLRVESKLDLTGQVVISDTRRWYSTASSFDFGVVNCEVVEPAHDFSGLSNDVIGDRGTPVPKAALESILEQRYAQNMQRQGYTDTIDSQGFTDSLQGLFYNLLRGYYVNELHSGLPQPEEVCYNDGHVSLTYSQATGGTYVGPGSFTVATTGLVASQVANSPMNAAHYNANVTLDARGWQRHELTAIIGALSAIDGVKGWPLGHDSDRLAESVHFFSTADVSDVTAVEATRSLLSNGLSVAIKLAKTHRLESQFDAALGMIMQVMTATMPVSAEGFWRFQDLGVMRLPRAFSTRGRWPELLTGPPANRSVAVLEAPDKLRTQPMQVRVMSLFCNSAAHNGLELYRREGFVLDAEVVRKLVLRGRGLARWALCIAKATGTSAWAPCLLPIGLLTPMTVGADRLVVTAIGPTDGYDLSTEGEAPLLALRQSLPQHPLLAIFHERGPLQAWGVASSVQGTLLPAKRAWAAAAASELNAAMVFMRVSGYDATANYYDSTPWANWADNGLGMPLHEPVQGDHGGGQGHICHSAVRTHSFFDVPRDIRKSLHFKLTHRLLELFIGSPDNPEVSIGDAIGVYEEVGSQQLHVYEPALMYAGVQIPVSQPFHQVGADNPVNPPVAELLNMSVTPQGPGVEPPGEDGAGGPGN
jgi:hypothetical protein